MLLEGQVTDRKRRLASAHHTRVRFLLASDEGIVASVRRGDPRAFEALYARHSPELLSFCAYMLASRTDAEDALQATFAAAYRSLRADERPIALRPWLFAIARNQCLTMLRRRRPTVELNGEPALNGDPAHELEVREEVRATLVRLRELPERQRAAMVLAELRGLSQAEIGDVLGVRAEQVKALVYQARANLISERRARETDCDQIREEIASARGAALLRGRLRRHLRSCDECRTFAAGVARQRLQLNSLLPFAPSLAVRLRSLQEWLATGISEPTAYAGGATLGGTVAAATLGLAGGGVKAIAVKVMAGAALLGLSTGAGPAATPSQPLARLAGEIAHVPSTHGAARGSTARASRGAPTRIAAARGGGAAGAGGGYVLSGGSAEARGRSESDGGKGGGAPQGGSSKQARTQTAHAVSPATHASAGSAAARAEAAHELRAQRRSERAQQHEEARTAREQARALREERRHVREEHRGSQGGERSHPAEELGAHEKRLAEHQRALEQHQREREKIEHQREREKLHAKKVHEHERNKRRRERTRERRVLEHEHGRLPSRQEQEVEATENREESQETGELSETAPAAQ